MASKLAALFVVLMVAYAAYHVAPILTTFASRFAN